MKTLHLNLASRPYRDYRPVWMVASILAIASAIFLINNAHAAYQYFVNTKTTRGEIERLQRETAEETRRARQLQSDMRRFDRKALNTQTRFINSQIMERSFSWSALLDQLERVAPSNVRLLSLNPTVSNEGIIHLRMVCVAKTSNGLVEMIRRLQRDPHFIRPFPESEAVLENGLHQFTIGTHYRADTGSVLP